MKELANTTFSYPPSMLFVLLDLIISQTEFILNDDLRKQKAMLEETRSEKIGFLFPEPFKPRRKKRNVG